MLAVLIRPAVIVGKFNRCNWVGVNIAHLIAHPRYSIARRRVLIRWRFAQVYCYAAPIVRNKQIVECADIVLAFWDGCSKGTLSVIRYCEKIGKPYRVIRVE